MEAEGDFTVNSGRCKNFVSPSKRRVCALKEATELTARREALHVVTVKAPLADTKIVLKQWNSISPAAGRYRAACRCLLVIRSSSACGSFAFALNQ